MLRGFEIQYSELLEKLLQQTHANSTEQSTGLPSVMLRVEAFDSLALFRFIPIDTNKVLHDVFNLWQDLPRELHDVKSRKEKEIVHLREEYGLNFERQWQNLRNAQPVNIDAILEFLPLFPEGQVSTVPVFFDEISQDNKYFSAVCHTAWNLCNGELNVCIMQNYGNMISTIPKVLAEFSVVQHLFARHLGVEPGVLQYTIADAFVTVEQRSSIQRTLDSYSVLRAVQRHSKAYVDNSNILLDYMYTYKIDGSPESFYSFLTKSVLNTVPKLCTDPRVVSFNGFSLDNVCIAEYNAVDNYMV